MPPLGPGIAPFSSNQIVFRVNLDHVQVLNGDPLGAHVAGQLLALDRHGKGRSMAPMEPA